MAGLYELEKRAAKSRKTDLSGIRTLVRRLAEHDLLPRNPKGRPGPSREPITTKDVATLLVALLVGWRPAEGPEAVKWALNSFLSRIYLGRPGQPMTEFGETVPKQREATGSFVDVMALMIDIRRLQLFCGKKSDGTVEAASLECHLVDDATIGSSFALRVRGKEPDGRPWEQLMLFTQVEADVAGEDRMLARRFMSGEQLHYELYTAHRTMPFSALDPFADLLDKPTALERRRIEERLAALVRAGAAVDSEVLSRFRAIALWHQTSEGVLTVLRNDGAILKIHGLADLAATPDVPPPEPGNALSHISRLKVAGAFDSPAICTFNPSYQGDSIAIYFWKNVVYGEMFSVNQPFAELYAAITSRCRAVEKEMAPVQKDREYGIDALYAVEEEGNG